ncbi:saccharopine dehydrogenase family protein [Streptomyces endophyticus]|uniref:Saccharopine dehydrogenase NADP-binding domain-containing protein n=1 Tax=Streptomyces endophyticus TaxID=714166 RepID=A0ABU6F258_9ACTN|nr:saccharopine dehydrogenase NADP-binding domain-containing protein [Streptomyces endophyticus]MEB8338105.1 saccharopine dehydrogenase NADP-binding domain-containing protein [Streptomyces endophyticus]
MSPRTDARRFDVVLLGATGFTGALTAEYLAAHSPSRARLALAGRNQAKLEAVRDRLVRINPQLDDVALLHADSSDPQSLARVAESARVVIRVYVEHHATAERTGARIVHACGFDSIPHDLGALFTVQQLPSDVPVTLRGVVRTNATISGGTLHSGLGQLSRPRAMLPAAAGRRRLEPRPHGRQVRTRIGRPRRDRTLDTWLIPLPTIDPDVVRRSALARPDYGPHFTYSHYAGARRAATVAGTLAGFTAALAAVQIPPLRRAIGRRIPQGEGPSAERRDRTWFTVDIVGEGGGQRVHTQVSGADPGYTETAKMLAESALCLAFDDNPPTAGQVTTATAMGENLLRRLGGAGISFTVITSQTATHAGR